MKNIKERILNLRNEIKNNFGENDTYTNAYLLSLQISLKMINKGNLSKMEIDNIKELCNSLEEILKEKEEINKKLDEASNIASESENVINELKENNKEIEESIKEEEKAVENIIELSEEKLVAKENKKSFLSKIGKCVQSVVLFPVKVVASIISLPVKAVRKITRSNKKMKTVNA